MPQLNPNPWLMTMLASWFTFSFIIQPKILTFITPNPPSNKTTIPSTTPWTWPWT